MFDAKTFVLNFSQKNPKYMITGLWYLKSKDTYVVSTQRKTWDGSMLKCGMSDPGLYKPNGEWFFHVSFRSHR